MAAVLPADSSNHASVDSGPLRARDELDDGDHWYFSRKEIEENSPSRRDGIELKKETYLRKSYCTFLQDLGMRLKVPQVTIATSIVFCHRFFLRQSHAKNDRRTIATVCMFLAGKVEDTPRPLKDVIIVSYEIIHKKDSSAVQRIKQKEVYEQQKELILLGERLVLVTLAFELNVHHPYKPLVDAIKKFKVAQNTLAQVAWNFVNDGLRTSLCLQFKPHHIAAGATFLAAKFLKVKLPSDGEKVWWQEFDVTPRQLEEVSNQMLELYEQNRVPQSQASEAAEASAGAAVSSQKLPSKLPSGNEEHGSLKQPSLSGLGADNKTSRHLNDNGSAEVKNSLSDQKGDGEVINHYHESDQPNKNEDATTDQRDRSPQEAIKKIDKDKVKAAMEKHRKKLRADVSSQKGDFMNEDDLIEHVLEEGIELPAERRKDDGRDENVS
ncbi:cyclin-T1-3-like [Impatiens glandulifera]|uniref:cyclin-T1-3-like n=1 Tax=Impatiens glandulifera TaxID=253017 RepID=UPI001FB16AC7|nr:cyclin-T1-3-like [Impatiens glandulifera]